MYLFGVPHQQLGFRLISLVNVDWSRVHPKLYRVLDGLLPRTEADAQIQNAGGGQYVATLSAGDTSGHYISYQLEADNCVSDEKTILPFDSDLLPFSVTVQDFPLTVSFPITQTLAFDTDSGFVPSQLVANTVLVSILDADEDQRGLIGTSSQRIGGQKTFASTAFFEETVCVKNGGFFVCNSVGDDPTYRGVMRELDGRLVATGSNSVAREGTSWELDPDEDVLNLHNNHPPDQSAYGITRGFDEVRMRGGTAKGLGLDFVGGIFVGTSIPLPYPTVEVQELTGVLAGQPVAALTMPSGIVLADAVDALSPAYGLAAADGSYLTSAPVQSSGDLTLTDWTTATGGVSLTPGALYYLHLTPGKLTLTPSMSVGGILQAIGTAIDAQTLAISIAPPILL